MPCACPISPARGGRVTFLVAPRRELGAAVGFYGGGIVTGRMPGFRPLIDDGVRLETPWLGLFGDADTGISVDDVERLRATLDRGAKVAHEIVRNPRAQHGFHCDRRASYDDGAAKDGWTRTLDWLGHHLGRSSAWRTAGAYGSVSVLLLDLAGAQPQGSSRIVVEDVSLLLGRQEVGRLCPIGPSPGWAGTG